MPDDRLERTRLAYLPKLPDRYAPLVIGHWCSICGGRIDGAGSMAMIACSCALPCVCPIFRSNN